MALGGGTWQFQNKVLPGTYINFVSRVRAEAAIADRGYATMPITGSWGPVNSVFAVTSEQFQTDSLKLFGYDYTADELKGLRDLFLNAQTVFFYRMDNGGVKATCETATAKYPGTRGNDLSVTVSADVDDPSTFVVSTYMMVDGVKSVIDTQKGKTWADIKDNDFLTFAKHDSTKLAAAANVLLEGGTDGEDITGLQYQNYIDAISPYYFNTMGYPGTDSEIISLLVNFTKRMRDETGAKFQLVVYEAEGTDYEGVISIQNAVEDEGASPASLVYWLTGAEASCEINASLTNTVYNGEYTVDTALSQQDLERAIQLGRLVFHNQTRTVSGELVSDTRVLKDINTFTTFTKTKNSDFSLNQVIRVLDQIAIDVANLFNTTYLGHEQNDDDGRKALWGDIVYLHNEYARIRAIQNFSPEDIPIPQQGTEKTDVVLSYAVQPTCCMEKLYMTVEVA